MRLLARNWRCRHGEIDLIAEETARWYSRGPAAHERGLRRRAESITSAKRSRLLAAARLYLSGRPDAHCRFDVFLVEGEPRQVRWIRDALASSAAPCPVRGRGAGAGNNAGCAELAARGVPLSRCD
jgi:putative endonuclease